MSAPRVVVAGGSGNVGTFMARALLERGATVVVPSRSEKMLAEFRTHLFNQVGPRTII